MSGSHAEARLTGKIGGVARDDRPWATALILQECMWLS